MSHVVRKLVRCLDNPAVWQSSRWLLNQAFGLYRKRFRLLQAWGVLHDDPSVLDVGCGIGQYAQITRGRYLGVDLDERYVAHAGRRYRSTDRTFRAADVTRMWCESESYDVVLMVDFLHHLDDDQATGILRAAQRLSGGYVVSFEPVKQQTNRVGQWIIDNDRGNHIRPLDELHRLFERAGLPIARSDELYLGPIRTRAILCDARAAGEVGLHRAG